MRRSAGALLAIGLAFVTVAPGATTAAPPGEAALEPSAIAVANAKAERAALGLSADVATVTDLLGSARDVGTPMWGMAMTAEEAAAIDLPGRSEFAREVQVKAIPYAKSLPGFGGVYFDAASNGELVIILKERDPAGEAGIAARMPGVNRGLRFVYRTLTDKDLGASLRRTETKWDVALPGVHLERALVDLPNGRIVVEVSAADVKAAQAKASTLAEVLGAPVMVRAADPGYDTACPNRDNCIDPAKAGIRLYKGSIDSVPEATLGWMVVTWSGVAGQFVTAGHAGYTGSNSWLHPGEPGNHVLGTEKATAYYNNGWDVMRVGLPDAYLGDRIYGETRPAAVTGYGYVGMQVYDSRGRTNVIDGGTIESDDVRWWSNTGDIYVYGGSTNGISQQGGDSGSPLYERYTSSMAAAIGIVNTSNGNFTHVNDIVSALQCYIWVTQE